MIANDNAISTSQVPTLPYDLTDVSSYDAAHVAERMGYAATGTSSAADSWRGLPWDTGSAVPDMFATTDSVLGDIAPMALQGAVQGEAGAFARESGSTGVRAQTIVGLDAGYWAGSPRADQAANGHGILLARAGAPTDDGRLPAIVARDGSGHDVWTQLDDGLGVKHESAPPLAYGGILYDVPITDGFASPGGNTPALPALDAVQVNTYRIAPTPWDEYNYIGGPLDG
jgi:hypothetical protein